MGIGLGVLLIVVGLILLLNVVQLPAEVHDVVATQTLGWILLFAGVAVIVLGLVSTRSARAGRSAPVDRR